MLVQASEEVGCDLSVGVWVVSVVGVSVVCVECWEPNLNLHFYG